MYVCLLVGFICVLDFYLIFFFILDLIYNKVLLLFPDVSWIPDTDGTAVHCQPNPTRS